MKKILFSLLGLFVILQLIPIGLDHSNPPIVEEPAWDSEETRDMVKRSCFDCHSNETNWPWYSWVAPMRFLVADHVEEGREHLNFSEWDRPQKHAHEAAEEVEDGEMPESSYLWLHGEADLSGTDRQRLAESFRKMFGDGVP